jgi:hypothetical protein
MRVWLACAVLFAFTRSGIAIEPTQVTSCEDECRAFSANAAAACAALAEGEGARCLEAARASLDLCMRLCED